MCRCLAKRLLVPIMALTAAMPVMADEYVADPETLAQVLQEAGTGDRILLDPGIYRGGLDIDRGVTLVGRPGAVIDAGGEGDAIRIHAARVVLRDLTIRNWGANLTAMNAGIFVEAASDGIRIEGNTLTGPGFGIWLESSADALITGNRVIGDVSLRSQDRGNGIHLFNVTGVTVAGNHISQARDGIYIDTSNSNVLQNNLIEDLRYGIHYMYSHDNLVIGNRTRHTRTGYALMQSRHLTVNNNRSENDKNYGILMNYITYSTLTGNAVEKVSHQHAGDDGRAVAGAEGKAVFIYNSQFNTLRDNRFADSDIGIHLTAGSEDNVIYGNAFLGNREQVKYVASRRQEWSQEKRGNYWSDYLGWDFDGDGLGDTVYEPNDAVDKLLWKYPLASLLMHSPAVIILRWVQFQFPVLRPEGVQDSHPLMRPPAQADNA